MTETEAMTDTKTRIARVYVNLKEGTLDPQGETIQKALRTMGYSKALSVRCGKVYEIEMEDDSPESRKQLEKICQRALANPVIEKFEIKW